MLAIQQYLLNHTLEELSKEFSIKVKRHSKYNNLVHFSYNQLESDFSRREVQEARGLLLDESNNWQVVARGYDKFWEQDNPLADKIDWNSAKVYEKVDGSLCYLWYYANDWHVSTTGTPDGSGQVGDWRFTFSELFWKVFNELGYKVPDATEWYTFLFELCTPFNKVIVNHQKNKLILHGIRDNHTQQEILLDPWHQDFFKFEIIKSYPLQTIDEVLKATKELDATKQEGFVVVDKDFHRIKVKSPTYLLLSHLKEGMTRRKLLDMVRMNGGINRALDQLPELQKEYYQLNKKYFFLILDIQEVWNKNQHITNRKEFAEIAKGYKFSSILFGLFDKKDLKTLLQKVAIETLEKWIL
jgi:hypothetical protein